MAGHSRWANIRHKKEAQDRKRGKIFGKLFREITVAARLGGGDPDYNPRLRAAIENARAFNMPMENIERAIKKGTGELADESASLQEVTYEGYGPGGVAIYVEAMTDNRNRTSSELRHLFSKHGGSLGEAGCVAWMFQRRGFIQIPKTAVSEDRLYEIALELEAEDVRDEGDSWAIYTDVGDFWRVREGLERYQIPIQHAELAMIPQNYITPPVEEALKVMRLVEALEDHDDVQRVWTNMELTDEVLQRATAA
ncbi:putative transcriptional regulatory protein [bacterium HR11]|nr:putative transcriptional regulatory protein [bacterium HR11]